MSKSEPTGLPIGTLLSRRRERGFDCDPLLSLSQRKGIIPQDDAGRRNISSADKTKYWRVYPGDIVYNTMRMWQGASARSDFFGIVSPAYTVCCPASGASSRFLSYALKLPEHIRVFRARSQGLTSDVWNLRFEELARIELKFVPDYPQQEKIAAILSSVDDAIEKTQAVIDQVQFVKRGLMQELLTRGMPGRHTRFKQTEIGRIPEDWRVVEIGELGHDSRTAVRTGPFGSSMKTKDFRPSGVPVLTIQSLGEGELNSAGVFFVSREKADELSEFSVAEGDLVFSRVADIGRSLAVDERLSGWLISPNLMRIRLDHRQADARFMMYSITLAKAVQRQIANLSGNAGRPVVSSSILRRLRVPVPPLREQCEIVLAGREIENRVKTETEKRALLLELKSALTSALLTGELRVTPDAEAA